MNQTAVKSKSKTSVKSGTLGREFDKVTFFALSAVAIGFGVFALASVVGAASTVGLGALTKGWLVAIGLV